MPKIGMKDRSVALGVDRNALPHPDRHAVREPTSRSAAAWAAIARIIFGTHVLALADQAIVSGTSLLSTVLVGRFTQPSQLGIYAIGLSVLGFVLAVQDALVLMPYTIQRHRSSRTPAQHAGLALLHSTWLAVAAIVVLAIVTIVMIVLWGGRDLTWLVCTLVLTVPFVLQREFNRTYAFAHLNVANAFILDAGVAAVQLPALAWLGWTGRMSAVSASVALGGACALTSLVWLYLARRNFSVQTGQVRQATADSWRLGKWLCAGQITVTIQSYVTYWVLPLLISLVETGVFAACNSIASLANPLLSAFRNTLTPRSVLAFKEGGVERLRRQASRDALLLVGVMSLFWFVIFFGGDALMSAVYHDHGYDGRGDVVTILALAVLATAAGASASNAMASMERPRAVVMATSVGAFVTAVAVWAFTVEWGLLGAAYGILAGSVAGSAARWIAFLTIAARPGPEDHVRAPIVRVLQQFAQPNPAVELDIRQIGEGFQGRIYGIRAGRDDAVWKGYRDLAVKLYPDEPAAIETAKRQFDAQVRLHGSVDGRTVHDWTLRAPLPLHVSEAPPALVMTMAAGTDLNKSLAADSDQPPEVLAAMARVLVTVLQPHWASGSPHGDLCLQNILYDPTHRILTLVDADKPACAGAVFNQSYPAAYDLAGLLCDVATDIRTIDRRVALSKRTFVESALSAFLTMMEAPEQEPALIAEIRAFARAELKLLDLRWSPRGLFRLIQRSIAMPRIDRMLAAAQANVRTRHRLSVVGGGA
ncbi:O-antigen/teichoic acid export membrane protein [Bradyrhizobium sp. USDA 4451]